MPQYIRLWNTRNTCARESICCDMYSYTGILLWQFAQCW